MLRVVVSFAIGILLADVADSFGWHWPAAVSLGVAVGLLVVGGWLGLSARRQHSSFSIWGGCCLLCAIVALGCWADQKRFDAVRTTWPAEPVDCQACVLSAPDIRPRTIRYKVDIANRNVYLYVSGKDTLTFVPGDSLLLHAVTIRPPENFSPDLSFDYARSLFHKSISGTCFAKVDDIASLPSNHRRGVFVRLQKQLSEKYAHDPLLGEKEQGVIRALTLGDKSSLCEELRVDYAAAGVSHVLALSGLHVGIIFMLLSFCLRPFFSSLNGRRFSELLALLALWVFAFLSGFSPSIQRAVLMCTIYVLATLVSSDRSSLSALCLAAMVMLSCNPFALFDVGFELSFASMFSILCLSPDTDNTPDYRYLRFPWLMKCRDYLLGIVIVSLVAQAGTLPLTLHYFGRFPTCFLLSNLVIIPAVSVMMFAAVFWWIGSCLPFSWSFPGYLLNGCVQGMNRLVTVVANIPGSSIQVDDFGWAEVAFAYAMLFFIYRFCHRKPGALIGVVACLIVLLSLRLLA